MKVKRVRLIQNEYDYAKQIAIRRNTNKLENNVESKDLGLHSGKAHVCGAIGECAVAKLLTGKAKIDEEIRVTGDDGSDLEIGNITIEVKTRIGLGKDFAMIDAVSDLESNIGVLCWWEKGSKDVLVVRWITENDWESESKILHFGRDLRKGIEWQNMRPIRHLEEMIKSVVNKSY